MTFTQAETEDGARPRPGFGMFLTEIVFTLCGLLVFAVGLSIASDTVSTLGLVVLSGAAGARLLNIVRFKEIYFALTNVLAVGTLLSYGLGTAAVMVQRGSEHSAFDPGVNVTLVGDIAGPVVFIQAFYWMLVLASTVEARAWRGLWSRVRGAEEDTSPGLMLFFVAIGLIQLQLMISGQWSYMGVVTGDRGEVPVLATLISGLQSGLMGLCAFLAGRGLKGAGPVAFVLAVALLPEQIFWSLLEGRRALLYSLVLAGAFFLFGRRRAMPLWKLGGLAAVALVVVNEASKFFLAMRYVIGVHNINGYRPPLADLFTSTWEVMVYRPELIDQMQATNLSTRFFIIGYFGDIIRAFRPENAMYGLNILVDFVTTIPRVLMPGKTEMLLAWGDPEERVARVTGLPTTDAPWSAAVSAYADFTWAGALIYPAMFLLLGLGTAAMIRLIGNRMLIIFALAMAFSSYLSTESNLVTYFSVFRYLLIVVVLDMAIRTIDRMVGDRIGNLVGGRRRARRSAPDAAEPDWPGDGVRRPPNALPG